MKPEPSCRTTTGPFVLDLGSDRREAEDEGEDEEETCASPSAAASAAPRVELVPQNSTRSSPFKTPKSSKGAPTPTGTAEKRAHVDKRFRPASIDAVDTTTTITITTTTTTSDSEPANGTGAGLLDCAAAARRTPPSAPPLPSLPCSWSPDPYTMCCRQECQERQGSGEVSRFETPAVLGRDSGTPHNHKNNNTLDPRRAVAKYRRNERRYPPRTLAQLETTVRYLSELLIMDTESFLSVVEFVQDRLRAVQVDVTRQSGVVASPPQLQHQVARLHVLVLYLLHDCPAYARQLGLAALRTALAQYWNAEDPLSERPQKQQCSDSIMDDEMVSLTVLVQLNEELVDIATHQKHGSTTNIGSLDSSMPQLSMALTDLFRRHGHRLLSSNNGSTYLEWTLRLVSLVLLGHWQTALQHLLLSTRGRSNSSEPNDCFFIFQRLAQCCLAPSIPWMRWQALHVWNNCIGVPPSLPLRKNEGLSGTELARLLRFETAAAALVFAAEFLPVNDNQDDNDNTATTTTTTTILRFKGQAIRPFQPPSSLRPTLDSVILANCDDSSSSNNHPLTPSSMRVSSDGIVLPSAEWMRTILCYRVVEHE